MFEQFYALYPRKQKGAEARIMWNRLTDEEKELAMKALPNHVAYWKAAATEKEFIPLPASWLNPVKGRRWEDEIELPQPKTVEKAWWTTEEGMLAKGREHNTEPRPGETWDRFKQRLTTLSRTG